MIATIISIDDEKRISVRVRRGSGFASLQASQDDKLTLRIGDRIEVKRQTNNPYIIFVSKT